MPLPPPPSSPPPTTHTYQTENTSNVRFDRVASPAGFTPHGATHNTSITNLEHVQAHDNARYTIASACDGLVFPFAEHAGLVKQQTTNKIQNYQKNNAMIFVLFVSIGYCSLLLGTLYCLSALLDAAYTEQSYKALLALALDATQGRGSKSRSSHPPTALEQDVNAYGVQAPAPAPALWAVHYGWMWTEKNRHIDDTNQVDPSFLRRMMHWDHEANVDAVVLFAPGIETGRVAAQEGVCVWLRS